MSLLSEIDVVVLGGGPAGAATALNLKQEGYSVVLIEPTKARTFRMGETVPPAFSKLLDQLNAGQLLANDVHLASEGNRSIWGSEKMGFHDHFAGINGNGWHLNRARFEEDLLSLCQQRGIRVMRGWQYTDHQKQAKEWEVALENEAGKTLLLQSEWVVDATGSKARFAKREGSKVIYLDKLIGIGQLFKMPYKETGSRYTLVESTSEGWWYRVSLPDQLQLVIFFSDSQLIKTYTKPDQWMELLTDSQAVFQTIKEGLATGTLMKVPAFSQYLDKAAGEGWFAVGDAAFSTDPLSSSGIYKAFLHGSAVAKYLNKTLDETPSEAYTDYIHGQVETYRAEHLQQYQKERRWSDAPFWKARHGRIHLSPDHLVSVNPEAPNQFNTTPHLLPSVFWNHLEHLAQKPLPAFELVRALKQQFPQYTDGRIVQAVQFALERKMLHTIPFESDTIQKTEPQHF